MAPAHAIYSCRVGHVRHRPFRHAFNYRVWSLLVDLDRLGDLPWPLTHNRPGLLSIKDKDHGARDGSPLRPFVEAQLQGGGITPPGGRIRLFCFPRVLGHTFNPISVYFCDDAEGRLAALVYEVKNTFGDQHCYVAAVPPAVAGPVPDHDHAKEFHVSPFFGMEGRYRFRVTVPGEKLSVVIDYHDADGPLMTAAQTGTARPLTTRTLLGALATHPLVTLKVVAGIHWEALRLFLKGAKFHRRPDPPIRLSGDQTLARLPSGPNLGVTSMGDD